MFRQQGRQLALDVRVGKGGTATGALPANPRTTPRSAPEVLLEWQKEVGLPPTRRGGSRWGGQGWVFKPCKGFFSCSKGYSLVEVHRLLIHCTGFSCCRAHALERMGVSSCGKQAYLFRGMWDLPRPGIQPTSLALAGECLATGPPRKSSTTFFDFNLGNIFWICLVSNKSRINQWDSIQLKSFSVVTKETLHKMKRQPTACETILANYTCKKRVRIQNRPRIHTIQTPKA